MSATAEILPERAEVGLGWSCPQESLRTKPIRSPTRAFEPEEGPGRCCYTGCMFPTGRLPRGSTTKAEEQQGELSRLARVMAWVPWLRCLSEEVSVIKACSRDLGEKYTRGQRDQRQSNVHHLMLLDQLAWQTTDVFTEHIVFIYWFMAALSNLLSHGRILWSGKCWVSPSHLWWRPIKEKRSGSQKANPFSTTVPALLIFLVPGISSLTMYPCNFFKCNLPKNLIYGRFAPNLTQVLKCGEYFDKMKIVFATFTLCYHFMILNKMLLIFQCYD